MPKIDKLFTLEVTVEQFLKACSNVEIQELDMLLGKEIRIRQRGMPSEYRHIGPRKPQWPKDRS